jgi:hypothetical protein
MNINMFTYLHIGYYILYRFLHTAQYVPCGVLRVQVPQASHVLEGGDEGLQLPVLVLRS